MKSGEIESSDSPDNKRGSESQISEDGSSALPPKLPSGFCHSPLSTQNKVQSPRNLEDGPLIQAASPTGLYET